ncbi:MAG: SRPBCC domain-containing protein [Aequorivita sp.]|nr:SRPBCC domain-containing protein [Aequorivita sp.]
MKNELLMDFSVNKETATINVTREFAADQPTVWAAWTQAKILDQWWAPKPWKSVTKSMEFKEGGRRLYAMVGPEGEEHWSLADFTSISPKDNFKHLSAFCDSEGNISPEIKGSHWNVDFSEKDGITTVTVTIKHDTLETLEQYIKMGFKEGFTMCLGNLDEVLRTLK